MAYDWARGVIVLVGGGDLANDTWEWQGDTWVLRAVSGPANRTSHTLAYDSARGVTVLFGGLAGHHGLDSETWEWNGSAWTQRTSAGPSARGRHAMVYDSVRNVTVLFGGMNEIFSVISSDTWEWNGTAWTQRQVVGPSARYGHAMAFDSARGVTVLFGGAATWGSTVNSNSETWEWDGSTWTLRAVAGPPRGAVGTMTYDVARGVTVLFGGIYQANGSHVSDQTWEWNGTAWRRCANIGPNPRYNPASAYDAGRRTTVLYGGLDSSGNRTADTWTLNGPARCPADLDNDGDFANGLARDSAVTIDDLLAFLSGFETSNALVDLDNGTNTGTPDGGVDINDLLYFLVHFEAGC